jgi:hypothetical protein
MLDVSINPYSINFIFDKEGNMNYSKKYTAFFLFLTIMIIGSSATVTLCQPNALVGTSVEVDVKKEWNDSGIFVSVGDTLLLYGFGALAYWPEGSAWYDLTHTNGVADSRFTVPGVPVGAIIGRIGNNGHFVASGSQWLVAWAEGNLFFTVNDWPGAYDTNRGTAIVRVKILRNSGNTSVMRDNNSTKNFDLSQNYPNPFNPTTTIDFEVQKAGKVRLEIYNILGQLVRTLINDEKSIGEHSVVWDGTNEFNEQLSSGTYYYRFEVGDFVSKKKMLLLK